MVESVGSTVSFSSPVCAFIQKLHAFLDTELGVTVIISQLANIVKMKASKHYELNCAAIRFF